MRKQMRPPCRTHLFVFATLAVCLPAFAQSVASGARQPASETETVSVINYSNPRYSPDGKMLIYERWEIQLILPMKTQDDVRRRLTLLRGDGKIVPGTRALWLTNVDGSQQRKLIGEPEIGTPGDPRFSPDGNKIVFSVTGATPSGDLRRGASSRVAGLWMINVDGTSLRRLTNTPSDAREYSPHFTWDGRAVVFIRREQQPNKSFKLGVIRLNLPDGKESVIYRSEELNLRTVVPIAGGDFVVLCECEIKDGKLVSGKEDGIFRISVGGSHPRTVLTRSVLMSYLSNSTSLKKSEYRVTDILSQITNFTITKNASKLIFNGFDEVEFLRPEPMSVLFPITFLLDFKGKAEKIDFAGDEFQYDLSPDGSKIVATEASRFWKSRGGQLHRYIRPQEQDLVESYSEDK
jgi:hypothetical protein